MDLCLEFIYSLMTSIYISIQNPTQFKTKSVKHELSECYTITIK